MGRMNVLRGQLEAPLHLLYHRILLLPLGCEMLHTQGVEGVPEAV